MIRAASIALVLLFLHSSMGCAGEPVVLVVSQGAATLTAIDAAGRVESTLGLDKAPAAIAVDAVSARAFVSHPDLGRITVVDLATWRVERSIDLGGQPFGLALTGDGRLLVTDWSAGTLGVVDFSTREVTRVPVGRSPAAVVVDDRRGLAYCIDREGDDVAVIDLSALTVIGRIATGHAPFAAALSADGSRLFVANVRSGDLSVIDTAARREIRRVDVGGMPYGVAVDVVSGHVLVSDQEGGRLAIVDPDAGTVVGSVRVGDYAEGVAVIPGSGFSGSGFPDSRRAAVADWFSDDVALVDLTTRHVTRVPVPAGPRMLAVLPSIPE